MRMLTLLALMLLALPGTALAAPPANDNRADAEAIPAFPHTLAATTAEATVDGIIRARTMLTQKVRILSGSLNMVLGMIMTGDNVGHTTT